MLTGQRGRGIGILVYRLGLRAKERGFTLIELLIAGFILSAIIGALFLSLTAGDSSTTLGLAKADLQAKVRLIMEWIVKDVRQTNLAEIDTHNPSGDYIKFRKVTGIDNITGSYTLSPDYTEYNYTSVSGELRRNEVDDTGSILRSLVFSNITQSPFYTEIGVALTESPNPGNILSAKKLVIIIAAQGQVRSGLVLNFSLTEEVKIRNP